MHVYCGISICAIGTFISIVRHVACSSSRNDARMHILQFLSILFLYARHFRYSLNHVRIHTWIHTHIMFVCARLPTTLLFSINHKSYIPITTPTTASSHDGCPTTPNPPNLCLAFLVLERLFCLAFPLTLDASRGCSRSHRSSSRYASIAKSRL